MKIYTLALLALILLSMNIAAQDTTSHFYSGLMASNYETEHMYKPGTRLLIKYGNENALNKQKGILTGISATGIALKRRKNSDELTVIRFDDMAVVKKVHPQRTIIFAAVGTALVTGGAIIIDGAGNTPGSTLRAALAIPLIGVGTYLVCSIPVSLLIDKFSERKRSSGWKFFAR